MFWTDVHALYGHVGIKIINELNCFLITIYLLEKLDETEEKYCISSGIFKKITRSVLYFHQVRILLAEVFYIELIASFLHYLHLKWSEGGYKFCKNQSQ